jgi:hypothetical protein
MQKDDILGTVRIASPCRASWEGMEGDERSRHCEACNKNVYNLSGMTRAEAEALVTRAEGRLCVRFYRRADGTMLTQDCPVGVWAMRKRMATTLACAATLFISLYSYAANLVRRPIEPVEKREPLSAYEQARKVEAFRIVLDRLNPPPPPPMVGSITVGMVSPIRLTPTTPPPTKGKN